MADKRPVLSGGEQSISKDHARLRFLAGIEAQRRLQLEPEPITTITNRRQRRATRKAR